jgi:hypothetical protein
MRGVRFGSYHTSDWGLFEAAFDNASPDPKTYLVDVPGSSDQIDLTEINGDVEYSQVTRTWTFRLFDGTYDSRFAVFRAIRNAIHGRRLDIVTDEEPDYTVSGRVSIDDNLAASSGYAEIAISADCDPYRSKGDLTWLINAVGGVEVSLPCGRRRACPTFEVQRETILNLDGTSYTLEAGTWQISDLWLTQGDNTIYINTYPDYSYTSWTEYTGTWADISTERWAEIAAGSTSVQESYVWTEYIGTWSDIETSRWVELSHPAESGDEYSAYVSYEWKDL